MMNWHKWLDEASQYLRAARSEEGALTRFSAPILYNLLGMSLESAVMAILDFHTMLPDNHTFYDLLAGLEQVHPLEPALRETILRFEQNQQLCSLIEYQRSELSREELEEFASAVVHLVALAQRICARPSPAALAPV
jgi:hypothetical protein